MQSLSTSAKTPIATTGLFATLRGLLGAKGTGAPFSRATVLLVALAATWGLGISTSAAQAALPAPGFTIDSFAAPTNFSETDNTKCLETKGAVCDAYQVTATNAGGAPTGSEGVTVEDVPPPGVTVQKVAFFWSGAAVIPGFTSSTDFGEFLCSAAPVTPVKCTMPFAIAPDDRLEMVVYVSVDPGAPATLPANQATVSSPGAPTVSTTPVTSPPVAVSATPAPFGASEFGFYIAGVDGRPDSQAGAHPYELTTTIGLNNSFREPPDISGGFGKTSVQDVKDIVVDLPLGFVGSTESAAQCTLTQLSSEAGCPRETQVGHLLTEPSGADSADSPIWNIVPEHGFPAEFGYKDVLKASHVFYTRVVPTPAGYVLRVTSPDIPEISITHIIVTFFGDPALRDGTANAQVPFFTNPAICGEPTLTASIHLDSWTHPGRFNADGTPDFNDPNWASATSQSPGPSGCNLLQFSPELQAQPTTNQADTPSGLDLELKLAQQENFATLATPPLKKATVTFPPGFTIDPSAGSGLASCSQAQIGWTGPAVIDFNAAPPACPEASKIGTLELTTPLIPGLLTGEMYVAAQNENPLHTTIGLYVVVHDPNTGVVIKIAGKTLTDPNTGQITGTFDENPQLPFTDLKLHFFGGPRAVFATPEACGSYTTTSSLEPWSGKDSGAPANPFDSFPINTGCVSGFNPSFTGGSTNLQAGAYTSFEGSFTRADTDQEIGGLSVTLPPGMSANLTGVPLCGEAQANAGTCPETSQIGTVRAGAGPGPNSLFTTGKAYLTGPYNGGAFGMSVVVPAIAGPFNFGNVVVRQSLRINPVTAQVTAVSDPFPTILTPTGADGQKIGIPIRLRRVDFAIDRPGFTFNPTNCSKLLLAGSMTSTQGVGKALEDPFQITNCANLKFTPKFAVSTQGKTSKAAGASLHVHLFYPAGALGTQANIARVKVDLPKQLPSRLTTLQKACTNAQFQANPAGCPKGSFIGHAKAVVPNIPVPLEGPAIFVSHGGEAFPSLIMVLQGYGVTVDLVGTTFISKAGITSTTFKTVPDAPVGSFELTLPQGKFSALAANGNVCKTKLAMPTEFLAQNGAKINQSTKVTVTGCAKKAKKATKHHKQHHGKKGKK